MNPQEEKEFLNILKQHSYFRLITDNTLSKFIKKVKIEEYLTRETIFNKGEFGSCMYFICKGKIKIHDEDYTLATLNEGDFFGEYSLIGSHDRSASATSNSATTLLRLDRSGFIEMMQTDNEFANGILQAMILRHKELDVIRHQLDLSKSNLTLLNGQLTGFLDGAMDTVILFDSNFKILLTNRAANEMLQNEDVIGRNVMSFLAEGCAGFLSEKILNGNLNTDSGSFIPRKICVIGSDGKETHTEGTLNGWKLDDKIQYSLILRNIEDKIKAENEIQKLSNKAETLENQISEITANIGFIAQDSSMHQIIEQINLVSSTDASVLIDGETGTGKELVAHAIHNKSDRKDGSFIKINCGAIPESLIESELFGHVKGAFTGANENRIGRFELADNGTLFLDEIGELPLNLQPKFLRVLQEGEFEPVGSSNTIKVNVRIIAATHRNLLTLVKKNEFREDLFYRLNVFPISLPPLRRRGNDIILIAQKFLNKFRNRMNLPTIELSDEDTIFIKNYEWPGNVRELQNIMERASIITKQKGIDWSRLLPSSTSNNVTKQTTSEKILTIEDINQLEKENILNALRKVKWKISGSNGAAALLKIKPTTLSSKIKALGIKRPI